MPNSADFNHFTNAPTDIDISRSAFNMQHTVKLSGDCGQLIPYEVREILPGDTFSVDTTKVIRLQPLVAPIMDELYADFYWFFCPNRLVYHHWINLMGENDSSPWAPESEYEVPQMIINSAKGNTKGSIADYMGIPIFEPFTDSETKVEPTELLSVSALPFRAYALTVDQWFRSEALQNPIHVFTDDNNRVLDPDNDDFTTGIELGGRPFVACKLFDQFTSALPEPQRGNPVEFDLLGFAPVVSRSELVDLADYTPEGVQFSQYGLDDQNNKQWIDVSDYAYTRNAIFDSPSGVPGFELKTLDDGTTIGENQGVRNVAPNNLWADMSRVTTFNVNDLRTAFAIQRYLERSARSGGRYIEMLSAFFHVDSPDARLQRVEYLGGSRLPININSVTQTSNNPTIQLTPMGTVAGMSVTGEIHSDFTKSFTEHGILLGLMVLRYRHSYSQGAEPFWFRKTKYDFYNPVFANLGEMPVYNKSIYADGSDADDEVFGYQEAWYDYRYAPNRVSAEMRPNVDNSLAYWHLGDYYVNRPYLNSVWIKEEKDNLDRCLAVTSDVSNQFIADILVDIHAVRPMPLYSIPGLIDHH